jgi:hypothetical protein
MPCALDNGKCLVALTKEPGTTYAFIQFHDGKVYRVSPVLDSELPLIASKADQPGCWFNTNLKRRRAYSYQRIPSLPGLNDPGWLSIRW